MVRFPAKAWCIGTPYLGCAFGLLFAAQCLTLAQLSGNGNFVVPLSDPQVSLGPPILTNGQVQLSLNGESGISYVIQSSSDFLNWTPVATNNDPGTLRTIIVDADAAHYYRASRAPRPLFTFALAARGNMNLQGNGQTTDSFNSADPAFCTNGQYDKTKARTNGAVASGGNIALGEHLIGGDLFAGTTATISSNIIAHQVLGTIHTNQTLAFPDVVLPNVPWLAAPLTESGHDFTVSGYYVVTDSSNLVVEPGVTVALNVTTPAFGPLIQILGGMTNSGTAYIFLNGPTNAFLSQYFPNNAIGQAKNLCIFGLPPLDQFSVGISNTNFTGVIYAPSARLNVNGGGTADGLTGSLVAGSILMNGHVQFHFDEDLLTNGPCR